MGKLKGFLGQNSFIMLNRAMMKEVGVDATLFLSILIDADNIFENEWVFQTQPTVEGLSFGHLTRRKQEGAIKILIEKGMISQKNMGLPMRRYFKVHEDVVMDVFSKTV